MSLKPGDKAPDFTLPTDGNGKVTLSKLKGKKVGILTPFQMRQAEIIMAEGQSQLEMKRVDLKNVEIRLARSRRRLKAVQVPSARSQIFWVRPSG